jgi:hypothetical protein
MSEKFQCEKCGKHFKSLRQHKVCRLKIRRYYRKKEESLERYRNKKVDFKESEFSKALKQMNEESYIKRPRYRVKCKKNMIKK